MTPKLFGLLVGGAFVGLFIFATLYKYVEVRLASQWPAAPGRVVSSKSISRRVGEIGGDEKDVEVRNFVEVIYEYEVRGRKLRGARVGIGEDLGNFQIEETLARYPAGVSVMVFYNPAKPTEAVLERNAPEGIFRFMAIFILGLVAFMLALVFGPEHVVAWLREHIPMPGNASLAVMLGFMGAFTLLIASEHARGAGD